MPPNPYYVFQPSCLAIAFWRRRMELFPARFPNLLSRRSDAKAEALKSGAAGSKAWKSVHIHWTAGLVLNNGVLRVTAFFGPILVVMKPAALFALLRTSNDELGDRR